jgi:hypothetical protein
VEDKCKGKDWEIFDHFCEFTYADGSVLNSQCRHIPGTMSRVDELIVGTKEALKVMQQQYLMQKENLFSNLIKKEKTILTKTNMMNCLQLRANTNLLMQKLVQRVHSPPSWVVWQLIPVKC